jgi:hypothetical protein
LDLPRVLTLLNEATRDLFLDKHEQNWNYSGNCITKFINFLFLYSEI